MENINFNEYVELKVSSLKDIYKIIEQYNKFWNIPHECGNTCQMAFYRGQSDANWNIEPSINRYLIDERQQYNKYREKLKGKSLFEQLAYLQHYETGTRMIDFTLDYNVALFFACQENFDKDGALFLYNYNPHKSEWIDTIIFNEIMLLDYDSTITIQELSENLYVKHLSIRERYNNISELNMCLMSYLDHGYMVLPSEACIMDNFRIKQQKGAFFICGLQFENNLTTEMRFMSNAGKNILKNHSISIPDSLKNKRPLVKLIIDSSIKKRILDEMNRQGINRNELFG